MSTEGEQFSEDFISAAANVESALGSIAKKTLGENNSLFEKNVTEAIHAPVSEPGKTEVSNEGTENANAGQGQAEAEQGGEGGSEKHGDAQQKTEPAGSDQVLEIDSPITGKVKIGEKKEEPAPANTVAFKDLEEAEKFFKESNFGDLQSLQVELPKLLKIKEEHEVQSKQLSTVKAFLEALPSDLFESMMAFDRGEDYRSVIHKSEPLDFQKKFADYATEKIVGHYFPDKLTAEDWAEYNDKDGDPAVKEKVKSFIDLSSAKFDLEQEKFQTQKKVIEERAKTAVAQQQKSFDNSRAKSIESLKGAGIPVDEKYVSQIDKEILSDQQLLSLFKNPDGTYKEDAHRNYIMAKDGFPLMSQFTSAAIRKTASEVRAELLDRAAGSQAIKKSGDGEANKLQDAAKRVEEYVGNVMPKPKGQTY